MFVLDHIFVCTAPDGPTARLRELGLTARFEREHPGQGTRNRLVLFGPNYLEILWLADREEAEGNLVRLDRRVDWRRTGASPFGIALRGRKDDAPEVPWVHYQLAGFPVGLWIDGRTLDDPSLPLVFVFDRPADVPAGPARGGYPSALLRHGCGATAIASATVEGPGLHQAPALPLPDAVHLADAPQPRLTLALDGTSLPMTDADPILRLGGACVPR